MSIEGYTEKVGKRWNFGTTTLGRVLVEKKRQGEYWLRHGKLVVGIYEDFEHAEKIAKYIVRN